MSAGDNRPTEQAVRVKDELTQQIDAELARLRMVLETDLPRFNELLSQKEVPGVFSEPAKVEAVKRYVRNQARRHRTMSFQDEFRALLRKHGLT